MNTPSSPVSVSLDAFRRIRVVLARPSHPGNIGSAARALKTMGLSRLFLVAPKNFPSPEATALASGAQDVLDAALVTDTLDTALADTTYSLAVSARARDLGPPTWTARAGTAEIFQRALRGEEAALVFGNETAGLSNAELQRCQGVLRIAANPEYSSLNLAAAVQIVAYELWMHGLSVSPDAPNRAMKTATPFSSPPATYAEQEGFYRHLEAVLIARRFLDPEQPRRLMPKLRRLFARARLEKDEVNILRGILTAASETKTATAAEKPTFAKADA
ncbi:MAG: RNA methyltransferase [Zoogloeaceae bacterium]|jgi:tRNA/rRNA methyltransferase|nr:RNA methyltransferase [Zoogloeaceae bacterium]